MLLGVLVEALGWIGVGVGVWGQPSVWGLSVAAQSLQTAPEDFSDHMLQFLQRTKWSLY